MEEARLCARLRKWLQSSAHPSHAKVECKAPYSTNVNSTCARTGTDLPSFTIHFDEHVTPSRHYAAAAESAGDVEVDACPLEPVLSAGRGIPALVRGRVWAKLLGVDEEQDAQVFCLALHAAASIPAEVANQIAKDVPRCHIYEPLISSPLGRRNLDLVLRAWVAHNSNNSHVPTIATNSSSAAAPTSSCYWQGVDSLAAVLLRVHDGHVLRSVMTLHRLICQHFSAVFSTGADQMMAFNRQLGALQRMLAFFDAPLCMHLKRLDVTPDQYAISWLLTWFAHTLPVHAAMMVWDHFLTGHNLLPLLFAVALLIRDRKKLLNMPADLILERLSSSPSVFAPLQLAPHPQQEREIKELLAQAGHLLRTLPLAILDSALIGLHQRETTVAEIVPYLPHSVVEALCEKDQAVIVDTCAREVFLLPLPDSAAARLCVTCVCVNVPFGDLSSHLLPLPNGSAAAKFARAVGEQLGTGGGIGGGSGGGAVAGGVGGGQGAKRSEVTISEDTVVVVTGPNEGCNRRLAQVMAHSSKYMSMCIPIGIFYTYLQA